jgi:hypothetical protein
MKLAKLETLRLAVLAGRWSFKDLLETQAAGIIMFDLAWCRNPCARFTPAGTGLRAAARALEAARRARAG